MLLIAVLTGSVARVTTRVTIPATPGTSGLPFGLMSLPQLLTPQPQKLIEKSPFSVDERKEEELGMALV